MALHKKLVSVDGKSHWSADASPPVQVLKQAEAGLRLHSGSQTLKYRVLPALRIPDSQVQSIASKCFSAAEEVFRCEKPGFLPPRERLHAVKTVGVTEKILSHALQEEQDGA